MKELISLIIFLLLFKLFSIILTIDDPITAPSAVLQISNTSFLSLIPKPAIIGNLEYSLILGIIFFNS